MTDLKNKNEWLRPEKQRGPDGLYVYTFKSSCCGLVHSWPYGGKPSLCPRCGDDLWHYPKHEYHLFRLQRKLDTEGEDHEKVLLDIFGVLHDYSRILLNALLEKNKISLESKVFTERAEELKFEMYSIILSGKRVAQSWGAWMKRILTGLLWGKSAHDDELYSLNSTNGEGVEYWERVQGKNSALKTELSVEGTPVTQELTRLLADLVDEVRGLKGERDTFLLLTGLRSRFKKSPTVFFDRFFQEFGNETKVVIDAVELSLYEHYQEIRA